MDLEPFRNGRLAAVPLTGLSSTVGTTIVVDITTVDVVAVIIIDAFDASKDGS